MAKGHPRPKVDPVSGDVAVRRAIVECHENLRDLLRRRLGDTQAVEDVLHDAVVRALERADDLHESGSVRRWFARIVANTVADHFRRTARGRRAAARAARDLLAEAAVDEELDSAVCACLYKLLPTLAGAYADVLWRVDLLDQPREHVAVTLGTSVGNITVRLHRARQALRKRLLETCRWCPIHGFVDCRCDSDSAPSASPSLAQEISS